MAEVIANSPTPGVAAQLTTLGAAITTVGQTAITTVAAVTGTLLNGSFRIVIGDGTQNAGAYEICQVTAGQSGTSWTIVRGLEGSTAATWNNGTPIYHTWTAAGASSALTFGDPQTAPASGTFLGLPYMNGTLAASTGLMVQATVLFWPFILTNSPTLTAISVDVTTGGSTGSVIRCGIYNDSAGKPGSVLLDTGTTATTGTGIIGPSGLSQQLTPGRWWVGIVQQGAPVTTATLRRIVTTGQQVIGTVQPDTLAHFFTAPIIYCGYLMTGVTGALPTASVTGVEDTAGTASFVFLVALTF